MNHSPAAPTDVLYRFGKFIVDPVIGRLHYGAEEVPLTKKTFEVLAVLVQHEARIVEKDELFQLIWPDTVVEDNNLARCVFMLRRALRDRDPSSKLIITSPGRGYQFGVPVERIRRADLAESVEVGSNTLRLTRREVPPEGEPTHEPALVESPERIARSWRAIAVIGLIGMATVGGFRWLISSPVVASDGERRLWQLTSMAGLEIEPTWSPDGQFIAYSSNRSGNLDIWVQPVFAGTPIRITSIEVSDSQPAWSPDGRRIAFRSERDGGGLFVVPAFGGPAERLTDFGYRPMWSPDGAKLLFYLSRRPIRNRAFVSSLDGQPAHEVLAKELNELGTSSSFQMAWHPEGRRVSVLGWRQADQIDWTFFTVALDGTSNMKSAVSPEVRGRLSSMNLKLGRFVWSRDGRSIIIEGKSDRAQNLYRVEVNPATLEWTAGPTRLTTSTNILTDIALSPDGRLAVSSRTAQTRVWSFALNEDHRVVGEGEPITPDGTDVVRFALSNDEKQLAYWTERRGRHELWVRSISERRDELKTVEESGAALRWSPDGTEIAYKRGGRGVVVVSLTDQSNAAVRGTDKSPPNWLSARTRFVGCDVGTRPAICAAEPSLGRSKELRVVASDPSRSLYLGSMSPDGRWISFIARTDGSTSRAYLMAASGGSWIPLTEDDHSYADKTRWSPDGSAVFFASDRFGAVNIWGRQFDRRTGRPTGTSFQVTNLQAPERLIPDRLADLGITVSKDRLLLPITTLAGAVWVLDDVRH
jgi:Tol biopolymer transport system component/DNA-binding winged helix-turn-helix (wHTH) protein